MAIDPNNLVLIQEIEKLTLLDGRYESLCLANFNSLSGELQGSFSVVFKGIDRLSGDPVAIKFFTLNRHWFNDRYRRMAYEREIEILERINGVERCLQLVSGLRYFQLNLPAPGGGHFTVDCPYFVVEWLDGKLDDIFLNQHAVDPIVNWRVLLSPTPPPA